MKSIVVAFGALLLSTGIIFAQAPPMDMSWGIQNQLLYQRQGNAAAYAVARACLYYTQQLRARGYWGPVNCGATPQSLQRSINRANRAMQDYNRAQQYNSWRRGNAISDYDMRAIRGCQWVANIYGGRSYVCY